MANNSEDTNKVRNRNLKYIAAVLICLLLASTLLLIGVKLFKEKNKNENTKNTSQENILSDEKVCSKMQEDFVTYLQGQKKINILKFRFDTGLSYAGMGLGDEAVTHLAIVNAANPELLPGMGGLNKGITLWVREREGLSKNGSSEVWNNLTACAEGQTESTKKLGLAAYSRFNGGILLHVIGPQGSLVGNPQQCKNLSEVTELLTNAYKNCLRMANDYECSHIIFSVISGDLFCQSNSKVGFKKSEFLCAIQNAVKKFIEKTEFENIKVYFNI
ncbi:hypothetical protein CWI36_0151p0020 [Hamiltosporidium magnivora]|uniref:Macro domain-containing protein n=1 Tax=Hamiltosporidium magnivora TaxID=148818 RepID=A0A4Q9LJF0_9MICR|nr:hypothetical protein CWI36_0151p0020 [Hamiltosporidium magnivora]